jgi:hypothetical protein
MSKKILADYYPVYKDLSDLAESTALEDSMFNALELIEMASDGGLSTFQTVVLLVKNAFEGHVLLSYNIRPKELLSHGTTLLQAKPEMLIPGFYHQFEEYRSGLRHTWNALVEKEPYLDHIHFDALINGILINQLIRFPVSQFTAYDLKKFADRCSINLQNKGQKFDLVLLGERAVGESGFIDRVNSDYAEKFKEQAHQVLLREEVLKHYQRKFELALNPNIKTEEELDEWMYKTLVQDKLSKTPQLKSLSGLNDPDQNSESKQMQWFKDKIKVLYRAISKNCFEVHLAAEGKTDYPELYNAFLDANSIYIEQPYELAEAWLQYERMLVLLANVILIRKMCNFQRMDNLHYLPEIGDQELDLSNKDIKSFRRVLDQKMVDQKTKSLTDYKIKFVIDEDLSGIHKHFLDKHLEFVNQEIQRIQEDIKEILRQKSTGTNPNPIKKRRDLL